MKDPCFIIFVGFSGEGDPNSLTVHQIGGCKDRILHFTQIFFCVGDEYYYCDLIPNVCLLETYWNRWPYFTENFGGDLTCSGFCNDYLEIVSHLGIRRSPHLLKDPFLLSNFFRTSPTSNPLYRLNFHKYSINLCANQT